MRLIEAGRGVRFNEVGNAARDLRIVSERHVENSVGGLYADGGDRRGRLRRAGGIHSGADAESVHRVHDALKRIGQARVGGFDGFELGELEHGVRPNCPFFEMFTSNSISCRYPLRAHRNL